MSAHVVPSLTMLDRWLHFSSKARPPPPGEESDDSLTEFTAQMNTSDTAPTARGKSKRARSPPGKAPHEPPPSVDAGEDPLAYSRDASEPAEPAAATSSKRRPKAPREAPADAPSRSPKGFLAAAADVPMIRAQSRRTSRQARPSDPSDEAKSAAVKQVMQLQLELTRRGARFQKPLVFREGKTGGGTSKGSMVTAAGGAPAGHESNLTHIAGLKSRASARDSLLPTWFTGPTQFPPVLKDMAEATIWGNALNCALTRRSITQGGALQIRGRIDLGRMERCTHAQMEAVQTAVALAKVLATRAGAVVVDQIATTAPSAPLMMDVSAAALREEAEVPDEPLAWRDAELFVRPCTLLCSNNSRAYKLGVGSVVFAARRLANMERESQAISRRMLCTGREALKELCGAILTGGNEGKADPVWASIAVIIFLTSHPRLRVLLSDPALGITPLDLATAAAVEYYGRTELVRRSRLDLKKGQRQQSTSAPRFEPSDTRRTARDQSRKRMLAELESELDGSLDEDEDDDVRRRREALLGSASGGLPESSASSMPPPTPTSTAGAGTSTREGTGGFNSDEDDEDDDDVWEEEGEAAAEAAAREADELAGEGGGAAAAVGGDPRAMLEFWRTQLAPEQTHASVLRSLVAVSRSKAAEAAKTVLSVQARDAELATNAVLLKLSEDNSLRSAEMLSSLLGRRAREAVKVVACNASRGVLGAPARYVVAVQEAPAPAVDAGLFVFRRAAAALTPDRGFGLAHAIALCTLAARDNEEACFPTVLERVQAAEEIRSGSEIAPRDPKARGFARLSGARERDVSRMKAFVREATGQPTMTDTHGTVRTLLTFDEVRRLRPDQASAAVELSKELVNAYQRAPQAVSGGDGHVEWSGSPEARVEPLSTPACRVAIAKRVSDQLVRQGTTKSRRGRTCKAYVGPQHSMDHRPQPKEQPIVADNDPPPVFAIMDSQVNFLSNASVACGVADGLKEMPERRGGIELKARHDLLLCGDNGVRVPEALAMLRKKCLSAAEVDADKNAEDEFYFSPRLPSAPAQRLITDVSPQQASAHVRQQVALLLAASSASSLVECYGSSMGATWMNSQINQSKRPSVADNTTLLFCTAYDTYCAGLKNVRQSFQGTGWAGAYGPRVDHGIGSVGLLCKNVTSDGRQHGSVLLSQKAADVLVGDIAANFAAVDSTMQAYFRPVETRGIPHGLVPGVHRCLNELVEATATLDKITGSADRDTASSLLVLPMSRYTQSLAPHADPQADASQRFNVWAASDTASLLDGLAWLPDATAESDAIAIEPHISRPNQASFGSNFMATAYDNVTVVYSSMCALGLLARELYMFTHSPRPKGPLSKIVCRRMVNDLFDALDDFHTGQLCDAIAPCALFLPIAAVLVNTIYPANFDVGGKMVLEGYAKAVGRIKVRCHSLAQKGKFPDVSCTLPSALREEEQALEEAQNYWHAFVREENSARPALVEGVSQTLADNGRYDASTADCEAMRAVLVGVLQNAWRVHSPDGTQRPTRGPAAEVDAPEDVLGPQIGPVFYSTESHDSRGGLVGMSRFQWRQLLALCLGAHLEVDGERVQVQAYRNEGSLVSRTCAAADMEKMNGRSRANKGKSALQTDSDYLGFGCADSKLIASSRQREAFDANALLCRALLAKITKPLSHEERWRGELVSNARQSKRVLSTDRNQPVSREEAYAERLLHTAAVSALSNAARERERGVVAGLRAEQGQ